MTERQEQKHSLHQLIDAHKKHLDVLEMQAAQLGINTPPHIVNEITRYKAEIHDLLRAAGVTLSDSTVEQLSPIARYQLLYAHMLETDRQVYNALKEIREIKVYFYEQFNALQLAIIGQLTLIKGKTED